MDIRIRSVSVLSEVEGAVRCNEVLHKNWRVWKEHDGVPVRGTCQMQGTDVVSTASGLVKQAGEETMHRAISKRTVTRTVTYTKVQM